MTTIRLTTAQAIVRWLLAQRTVLDGDDNPAACPGGQLVSQHACVRLTWA